MTQHPGHTPPRSAQKLLKVSLMLPSFLMPASGRRRYLGDRHYFSAMGFTAQLELEFPHEPAVELLPHLCWPSPSNLIIGKGGMTPQLTVAPSRVRDSTGASPTLTHGIQRSGRARSADGRRCPLTSKPHTVTSRLFSNRFYPMLQDAKRPEKPSFLHDLYISSLRTVTMYSALLRMTETQSFGKCRRTIPLGLTLGGHPGCSQCFDYCLS